MSPLFFLSLLCTASVAVALTPDYYSRTCPQAESIVKYVMKKAVMRERRNAASILRMQFHDCFVNGCDASVLLDDTPTMIGEKLAIGNRNSLRAFYIYDAIKIALEKACPGVVSCADVIVMAARDAVGLVGGPTWNVTLGRKDSLSANIYDSIKVIPSPRINATKSINLFAKVNLSPKDLVALTGSHTIGKGSCFSVRHRLYNQDNAGHPDPIWDPTYRARLEKICPKGGDKLVETDFDTVTPGVFDNQHYKQLIARKVFLYSDQNLFTYPETRKYVLQFSRDQNAFFNAFVEGMKKMGNVQSGQPGEVRRNCRRVNGH